MYCPRIGGARGGIGVPKLRLQDLTAGVVEAAGVIVGGAVLAANWGIRGA